jgi:hypothetical protein
MGLIPVHGADLHAHHEGQLAGVGAHVVHGHAVAVDGRGAAHESDQTAVRGARQAQGIDQLAVQGGAQEARRGDHDQLVDVADGHAGVGDGAAAGVRDQGDGFLLEAQQALLYGEPEAVLG